MKRWRCFCHRFLTVETRVCYKPNNNEGVALSMTTKLQFHKLSKLHLAAKNLGQIPEKRQNNGRKIYRMNLKVSSEVNYN